MIQLHQSLEMFQPFVRDRRVFYRQVLQLRVGQAIN